MLAYAKSCLTYYSEALYLSKIVEKVFRLKIKYSLNLLFLKGCLVKYKVQMFKKSCLTHYFKQ